jgi:histidinol-phosphatase (PHP family)
MLPPDNHSHSQWSWDAFAGSMEGSCAEARRLGLPSIAFTEHVDLTRWVIDFAPDGTITTSLSAQTTARVAENLGADHRFNPPPFDVDGYLACLERCRERFPDLRILSGVELGEPHWYAEQSRGLLRRASFERILGSLHAVEAEDGHREAGSLYAMLAPADLARRYLAELLKMVESSDLFQVLAHIDYPGRRWPSAAAGPFDVAAFEEEFRAVLRALARSGRALEVNTRLPLDARVVRWWHQEGGDAVSFGSDAHLPSAVAHGFAEAAAMVEAQGFRPGRTSLDFWARGLTR